MLLKNIFTWTGAKALLFDNYFKLSSFSERTKALIDYELDQLQEHGNAIYEIDYDPEWIVRSCLHRFLILMVLREDGIRECPKCHTN